MFALLRNPGEDPWFDKTVFDDLEEKIGDTFDGSIVSKIKKTIVRYIESKIDENSTIPPSRMPDAIQLEIFRISNACRADPETVEKIHSTDDKLVGKFRDFMLPYQFNKQDISGCIPVLASCFERLSDDFSNKEKYQIKFLMREYMASRLNSLSYIFPFPNGSSKINVVREDMIKASEVIENNIEFLKLSIAKCYEDKVPLHTIISIHDMMWNARDGVFHREDTSYELKPATDKPCRYCKKPLLALIDEFAHRAGDEGTAFRYKCLGCGMKNVFNM